MQKFEHRFMPMDLSEEEKKQFAEQYTKLFSLGRGSRRCPSCGHIARGKLAQSTAEERKRLQQRAADQLKRFDGLTTTTLTTGSE
jgi:hypothetical protein